MVIVTNKHEKSTSTLTQLEKGDVSHEDRIRDLVLLLSCLVGISIFVATHIFWGLIISLKIYFLRIVCPL